jgi:TrmH family RNA methyltransferase
MNSNLKNDVPDGRKLVSATNNLTDSDRKLVSWGKRKGLMEGGKGILLEGSKIIEEALEIGYPLRRAWHTVSYYQSNSSLIRRLEKQDCEIKCVSERLMKNISDLDTPPGLAAAGPQPDFILRQPGDSFSLIVAVSRLQDPGNLGGLVRSADFFGVDEIWLGRNSIDPYSPKAVRASMGAVFRMPIVKCGDMEQKLALFQGAGAVIWAAVAHADNAERRIDGAGARILLIGEESQGLDSSYLSLADRKVSIPGARRSESLNLAVAAGILIYMATSGRY